MLLVLSERAETLFRLAFYASSTMTTHQHRAVKRYDFQYLHERTLEKSFDVKNYE